MSTLRVTDIEPVGGGTSFTLGSAVAPAWGFCSSNTNTIWNSYNITSLTDGGTGLATLNMTNALVSTGLPSFASGEWNKTYGAGGTNTSTSTIQCFSASSFTTLEDRSYISGMRMGKLA